MIGIRSKAFQALCLRQSDSAICLSDHANIHEEISVCCSLIHEFKKNLSMFLFAMASLFFLLGLSPAYGGGSNAPFLVAKSSISTPAGFSGLCQKYKWVCAATAQERMSDSEMLRLATAVNTKVNRETRSIEDRVQYGREEHWSLPTARGGDCEDFVLLKKKILVEQGIAPINLLIATVLDLRLQSHAVLVLRTSKGDFVLDNLNNDIRSWNSTGYTFLKLQNPASPHTWHAVLAGGLIKERPTASKR